MDREKGDELVKLKGRYQDDSDVEITGSEHESADDKEVVSRETWGGQFECVLSLIGYTVGLGNIWRFPYFCYRNGGGIAILPFLLFLVVCGGPLYYMELCLGQFSGKSPISVWTMCPIFKGIGLTMVLCSLCYIWYFGSAFAWVFYFLIQSFYPTLPWSTCGNEWNTPLCIDSSTNMSLVTVSNLTRNGTVQLLTSGTEYWLNNVLRLSSGIDDLGSVHLHLVGCLFLGWFLVFLCLAKGVKTLGKVVYVTAILPYFLLTVLLIRSVLLEGAWSGLRLYFIPDFSKLGSGQLWLEAAVQCFYSLGPAWGGAITMASFNKFNHNALRDTLIVCFADGFTAIYGGIIVFSVLGFLSHETGTPIEKLPLSGAGLAFIAYPEALSRLPGAHVWSVLFFVTLALVGIDTQFGTFETASNAVIDLNYDKLHKYRVWISAAVVSLLFLTGIPIATSGGYYIFMLADWYVATFNIVFTAFLEVIVMALIYGANRFSSDIEMMTGRRPSLFVRISWCIIIPTFLLGILAAAIYTYSDPIVGTYSYPAYAVIFGTVVFGFGPLFAMLCMAVYQIVKTSGSFIQRIKILTRPGPEWVPNDAKQKRIYTANPYKYQKRFTQRILVDMLGINQNDSL
ncbi:hypothetical protein ACF0H5_019946 [Mactra antiquata]